MDTNGPEKSEVPSFQNARVVSYILGWEKVSCVEVSSVQRYPYRRVPLCVQLS